MDRYAQWLLRTSVPRAISLRELVNGAIHVLDTATLNVQPDTWYQLRLEAIGDRVRAYGVPIASAATLLTPTASGCLGE